jgi:predicted MFS family arabinose efflux permease
MGNSGHLALNPQLGDSGNYPAERRSLLGSKFIAPNATLFQSIRIFRKPFVMRASPKRNSQTMGNSQGSDRSYEWKAVTLLGLGFGLVGLDRWIIAPLFPFMMKDLRLSYQDLGNLIGVLGICWGIFAAVMGSVSDKIGRRKVLIPAILLFSILSGLSGLATGFMSLVIIRAIMGVMEGSFCPTSFAATNEASDPKRRGFNQGMQQCTFALFGLGFGPVLATQLLAVVPNWRWVFFIVAIPGIILGALMYGTIRDMAPANRNSAAAAIHPWAKIFHSRNIVLSMVGLLCAMTGVFVISAMVPNYLVDYLHLAPTRMGFVTSAIGFGGFLGQVAVPGFSDILGRKVMAIASFVGAAVLIRVFIATGANPAALFGLLFVISFFCLGVIGLITGPISTESAPAGLVSSAIGIVVGSGEVFGGGIAPSIAGYVAEHFGIQNILYLALWGVVLGIVVCLFLKETAPRKVQRHAGQSLKTEVAALP